MAVGGLEVLTALDKAKTQWYHFTAIIVAGMGFFTDAYDLFCISTVTKLLGRIYYYDPASGKPGSLPANVAVAVNGVALCGTLAGQLFFGWLGDRLGRKRVYGLTLMIMIGASIASALSFGSTAKSVMSTLCIFRFWLGFGIGGDYPLSATIMSEYANKKTRGAFIAAVFAMQGFGILAGLGIGGDYPCSATIMLEYANKRSRGAFIITVFAMLQGLGIFAGFGIGGDCQLSATIMLEYANKRNRGAFSAAIFTMQGFRILLGGAVAIIVSAGFNNADPRPPFEKGFALSTPPEADYVWRIIFMVGALPAALTYYWRMKMPETARYTALVEGNAKQAAQDMAKVMQVEVAVDQGRVDRIVAHESYNLFSRGFMRRHGSHLVGTCTTWFLLDVAFYSSNLFQKDVYTAVGLLPKAAKMSALEEVFKISRAQVLVALFSTVPGYWFTVALVDRVGRFAIQLMGFFMMTAFMFALSIPYDTLRGTDCTTTESGLCGGQHMIFIVLFAFTFFFANFGPNTTTFIVPAEIFPARFRSTCHGISSASGKAGAIVGAFGFLYAAQSPTSPDHGYPPGIGTQKTLIILACTNALGFLFTFLVPETKGRSLEDITGENDDESATTVG